MDIEALALTAEQFLAKRTTTDEFYRRNDDGDEVPIVSLQHCTAGENDTLDVLFMVDEEGTETDPAVVALVDGAMDALRAAHPEVAQANVVLNIWST